MGNTGSVDDRPEQPYGGFGGERHCTNPLDCNASNYDPPAERRVYPGDFAGSEPFILKSKLGNIQVLLDFWEFQCQISAYPSPINQNRGLIPAGLV